MKGAKTIDGLRIRQKLGRQEWSVPRDFGPEGWLIERKDGQRRMIVTLSPAPGEPDDSAEWIHASMSARDDVPTYEDLQLMHRAVFGDGWAYQVFAPPEAHVNIHPRTLHLWGRADGAGAMPNFGVYGTI